MKKASRSRFTFTFTFALTAALAAWTAPRAARAQDGAGAGSENAPPAGSSVSTGSSYGGGAFGQAGQWVYSIAGENEFPLNISKTGDGDWNMTLRPSVDTFLARSISVGGIVTLGKYGGTSVVGIGARGGYNIPITSLVSFWPRVGIGFEHYSVDNGPSGGRTTIGLNAPFLFHLVSHAFLGVGPFFSLPVQDSDAMAGKDATYGLTAIIGGWL